MFFLSFSVTSLEVPVAKAERRANSPELRGNSGTCVETRMTILRMRDSLRGPLLLHGLWLAQSLFWHPLCLEKPIPTVLA